MTKEEAVSWLRRYRRDRIQYGVKPWSTNWKLKNNFFNQYVYERYLVLELIRRINESPLPPIEVVRNFYHFIDDILCESDDGQFITHYFSSIMENCAGDILRYLREKDSADNRKEKKNDTN